MFIEKRTSRGYTYLWLTHKARVNGKSVRVFSIYLGPETAFKEHVENIKLSVKPETKVLTYDFGLPFILMRLVERLDLINIINECTDKRDQGLSVGEYMVIATLNRCIKPRSKNQIRKWFYSTDLQRMFPKIETYLDAGAYLNHFQYLTEESIEAIETRINQKLLAEFKVEMSELIFDPTNFFTFINSKDEDQTLLGHGHSKENRNSLNLVNLSVFCTRNGGIPVMHHVYPGGVHDAAHFKDEYPRFIKRLEKLGIPTPKITLVFDKGNISPEVFQEIDSSGIHWVASVRPSSYKDLQTLAPTDFKMYTLPNGKEVGILELKRTLHGKDRRLIVIYNPRRAYSTGKKLKRKLEAKINAVNKWFKEENRLNVKKWRSPKAVEEKIKDIIQNKTHLGLISYKVTGKYGKVKYNIEINKAALEEHLKTLGKGFFMSNHPTMSPPEIVWLYRQQFTIERAFKYLKNPESLRITPIFHRKDECIRGHIFTCILGLLLLTLLTKDVNKSFPELGLPTILDLLSEIKVAEIKFSGSQKIIRKIVEISPDAKKLSDLYKLENAL